MSRIFTLGSPIVENRRQALETADILMQKSLQTQEKGVPPWMYAPPLRFRQASRWK